ncbi:flavodoxin [Brackiella oedipodis]|uniref:flavodoxin n=1 Tax=Brackiella oedipodis TaxID=124225 RepID=UPI00048AAE2E|nr:flavodoxin [Brackiella oedipodis]
MTKKTLLIIYHSRTGAAKAAAQAAYEAALACRQELQNEHQVRCLEASQVDASDMLQASSYLFCAPENLAALSGTMKELFDRLYYPLLGQIEGREYGLIITAGSDGTGACRQAQRICQGWRLQLQVPHLIINTHSQHAAEILAPKILTPSQKAQAAEVGATLYAWL